MKNLLIALLLLPMVATADIAVSNVKVFSGVPWQEVIVGYTITGTSGGPLGLRTIVSDNDAGISWTNVTYDATALTEGEHQFRWNDAKVNSTNCEVKVQLVEPTYCIVDLSSGPDSKQYPVTYLIEEPVGGWTTEYKTTKLPLKLIPAGSFIMGEDQENEAHRVTITKPFYMGVFEVTQKQSSLIQGSSCASFGGNAFEFYGVGDCFPDYYVQYVNLRGSSLGAKWPASGEVDASSLLGNLRTRTGLSFDLPTEAQWEYACRAGTTTVYSHGDSVNKAYMWYHNNASKQANIVGTKRPNPWGLYDMHGNVWEWCLDWSLTLAYGEDPKGKDISGKPPTWPQRVLRGGSWSYGDVDRCTSAFRSSDGPSYKDRSSPYISYYGTYGFRLCLPAAQPQ